MLEMNSITLLSLLLSLLLLKHLTKSTKLQKISPSLPHLEKNLTLNTPSSDIVKQLQNNFYKIYDPSSSINHYYQSSLSAFHTSRPTRSTKHFNIHELSSDYHFVKKVIRLAGQFNDHLEYKIARPSSANNRVQYIVRKPIKMREYEIAINNSKIFLIANYQEYLLQFININSFHRGNYSVYLLEYTPNGTLITKERKDFEFSVEGLKTEGTSCSSNSECSSGHCQKLCVCNAERPVFISGVGCFPPKKINETCFHSDECRQHLGLYGECYSNKCQCIRSASPVKIGEFDNYCVKIERPLPQMNEACILSKECTFVSQNLHCSSDYLCECLPGFRLNSKNECFDPNTSSNSSTNLASIFLLIIVSNIYLKIVIN